MAAWAGRICEASSTTKRDSNPKALARLSSTHSIESARATGAYTFARAAGFLKRRCVGLIDHVRARQKLADIDAPELDQQPF